MSNEVQQADLGLKTYRHILTVVAVNLWRTGHTFEVMYELHPQDSEVSKDGPLEVDVND